MNKGKDIRGMRKERLVAVARIPKPNPDLAGRDAWWLCKCDCGNEIPVRMQHFMKGQKGCRECSRRGRPATGY
jgi:hypothetical protein